MFQPIGDWCGESVHWERRAAGGSGQGIKDGFVKTRRVNHVHCSVGGRCGGLATRSDGEAATQCCRGRYLFPAIPKPYSKKADCGFLLILFGKSVRRTAGKKDSERGGIGRALELARRKVLRQILVHEVSRIARKNLTLHRILEDLEVLGALL